MKIMKVFSLEADDAKVSVATLTENDITVLVISIEQSDIFKKYPALFIWGVGIKIWVLLTQDSNHERSHD